MAAAGWRRDILGAMRPLASRKLHRLLCRPKSQVSSPESQVPNPPSESLKSQVSSPKSQIPYCSWFTPSQGMTNDNRWPLGLRTGTSATHPSKHGVQPDESECPFHKSCHHVFHRLRCTMPRCCHAKMVPTSLLRFCRVELHHDDQGQSSSELCGAQDPNQVAHKNRMLRTRTTTMRNNKSQRGLTHLAVLPARLDRY
jgi:hypothetical protein